MSLQRARCSLVVLPLVALLAACGDDLVEEEAPEPVDVEVSLPGPEVASKAKTKPPVIVDVVKSTEYVDDWSTQR